MSLWKLMSANNISFSQSLYQYDEDKNIYVHYETKEELNEKTINGDIKRFFHNFPDYYINNGFFYILLKYMDRHNYHKEKTKYSYYECFNFFKKENDTISIKKYNKFMKLMSSMKLINLKNKDNKDIKNSIFFRTDWIFFRKSINRDMQFSSWISDEEKLNDIRTKIHIINSIPTIHTRC